MRLIPRHFTSYVSNPLTIPTHVRTCYLSHPRICCCLYVPSLLSICFIPALALAFSFFAFAGRDLSQGHLTNGFACDGMPDIEREVDIGFGLFWSE